MEDQITPDIPEVNLDEVKKTRCEQRFKIISDYKAAFGDDFDNLNFLNYKTGKNDIKGSQLRDAQTGCEIYERLGWDDASHNSEEFHKCGCKPFDEQLRFVSEEEKPLSYTDYIITLDDGRTVNGTTDDKGKTKRVKSSNKENTVKKVDFIASKRIQPLCPKNRVRAGTLTKTISPAGVATNRVNVGSSVKTITVDGAVRKLTASEIKMCRPIFKDSIKYSDVKIKKGQWQMLAGLHGLFAETTIMTPDGNLYCPDTTFEEDFSVAKPNKQIWFMHEMTHVWQYQLGYFIKLRGVLTAIKGGYIKDRVYKYDTTPSARGLRDYNFEQQAEIISHYWAAKYIQHTNYIKALPFYEQVLDVFLQIPKDSALLPRDNPANLFSAH